MTNLYSKVLEVHNRGIHFFCKWHKSLLKPSTVTNAATFIIIIVVHTLVCACSCIILYLFHLDKPMETNKFLAWAKFISLMFTLHFTIIYL